MFEKLKLKWHVKDVERRVQKHGWTAIYVGDYQSAPSWAYTVGLDDSLNHPEIVVFDVPQASANTLFWQVFEEIKAGTLVLEDGKRWPEDTQRPGAWRKVHPTQIDGEDGWFTFAVARRALRTGRAFGLEVFQYVLSDDNGVLPWEDGYNEQLRPLQPALYLPGDGEPTDRPRSEPERQARRLVRERGWAIVPVDGPDLHWAYTIGLTETSAAPDLIAFGPDGDGMARVLFDIAAHIRDGSLILRDGLCWDGLGFPVCFRLVHESQYLGFQWCYVAKALREERTGLREPVEMYQLFLPDSAGRFPWRDGCESVVRKMQPQLFLPLDLAKLPRSVLAGVRGV